MSLDRTEVLYVSALNTTIEGQREKIKDLEKKLAEALADKDAYETMARDERNDCFKLITKIEGLQKDMSTRDDDIETLQRNQLNMAAEFDLMTEKLNQKLALAVEALKELKELSCNCGKCASNDEPYFCIQCTALKQLSEN